MDNKGYIDCDIHLDVPNKHLSKNKIHFIISCSHTTTTKAKIFTN